MSLVGKSVIFQDSVVVLVIVNSSSSHPHSHIRSVNVQVIQLIENRLILEHNYIIPRSITSSSIIKVEIKFDCASEYVQLIPNLTQVIKVPCFRSRHRTIFSKQKRKESRRNMIGYFGLCCKHDCIANLVENNHYRF